MYAEPANEHQNEFSELSETLTEMATCVESMLSDALIALKQYNLDLATDITRRDVTANNLQRQIDDDALRIMTLNTLPATQVRRIVNMVRIANDLERIGDLASGVAKRISSLTDLTTAQLTTGIERMGRQVGQQLDLALGALTEDDPVTAMQVWMADDEIDGLYDALFREFLTDMMEDPNNITPCTNLLFIAKNLERIGDHATNIAESVYFTVNGKPLIEDPVIVKFMST